MIKMLGKQKKTLMTESKCERLFKTFFMLIKDAVTIKFEACTVGF